MPGFIKDIGGSKRMRFVKPGQDPNNLNLDPNLVIFDSDTIGNLSVLAHGENFSPQPANTSATRTTQLASWSLPYTPMVMAQIKLQSDPDSTWSNVFHGIQLAYLEATPSGLWFVHGGSTANADLLIRWTAYRFPI
ncbi:hypothetical protein [Aliihoeflea sp. PC F10.4]